MRDLYNCNYNQRLYEVLSDYAEAICSYAYFGSPLNSDEDNIAGAEALYQTSQNEAKQAITSLIKELVAEAKPEIPVATSWQQGIEKKAFEDAVRVYEYKLLKVLNKEK